MAETSAAGAPLPFMGSGVKQDLHTLLTKFLALESDRIRDFAEVFREMQFETILHYRISPAEYVEFTEYLLQNAAKYFGKLNEVHTERSFIERIFGIYTCYAIYNLQPNDHVVQIPVTMLQYQELMEFQNELTAEKALEPIAALKNLLLKKAFKISVFQSTYDPATHKRYLAEEEMPEFKTETVEPFARAKQIETNRTMGELMYLHKAYISAKQQLGITDIKLVEQMNPLETIQQHIRTHQMAVEPEQVELPKSAGNSRSELRTRAYAAGMKHTRNRRYLDPNMEENFKNIPTFGEIAQQCLQEPNSSHPTTSTPTPTEKPKPKRRRAIVKQEDAVLTDEQIAEQVLQNEYASRVKPEVDSEETAMFGGKRQGTGGVAKIRAPPKKKEKIKLVEVKTERRNEEDSFSTPSAEPPTKKKRQTLPPRVSSHLASQFSSLSGSVAATDKKMKKLQTQIKIEPFDDNN